jgi:hypothetical protein
VHHCLLGHLLGLQVHLKKKKSHRMMLSFWKGCQKDWSPIISFLTKCSWRPRHCHQQHRACLWLLPFPTWSQCHQRSHYFPLVSLSSRSMISWFDHPWEWHWKTSAVALCIVTLNLEEPLLATVTLLHSWFCHFSMLLTSDWCAWCIFVVRGRFWSWLDIESQLGHLRFEFE